MHVSHQRVADESHGHTGVGKELFFKRKDAESLRETPPHQIHAPRPPSPELRADVIDVSNAFGAQLARQTQMKTGEVGQNRERWAAALGFIHEAAHGAEQRRQALKDFGDSYDRNV